MRSTPILLALALVAALGLGLRVTGLDRLQPHLQEADPYLVLQMQLHRKGIEEGQPLPHGYFAYPTLLARSMAWLPEARVDPETPQEQRLAAHLDAASSDFVRMRTLVALLASLLVPATFVLARRFVGGWPAVLSAALVATSLTHLLFSQEARPHGAHATFAIMTVLAAFALRRAPSWSNYGLAAFWAALSIGTLHTGLFALLPICAAHVLRERDKRSWAPRWVVVLPVLAAIGAALLLYPRAPTLQSAGGVWEFGGHTLRFDKLDGSGFAQIATYLRDCDPTLLVLACGGFVVALVRVTSMRRAPNHEQRCDLLVAATYALPYFLALGVFGEVQDRFLLPLIPFFALLGALMIEACTPPAGQARLVVGTLLAVAALAFPGRAVMRFASVRAAPDTVERAAAWVETNVAAERGRVLVSPRLALPLFHDPEALRIAAADHASRQAVWIAWQLEHLALEDDLPGRERPAYKLFVTPGKLANMNREQGPSELEAWLDEVRPEVAVLEVSRLTMFIPQLRALRDLIRERGRVRAHIHGEATEWCQEPPLDYQEIPHFARRILEAEAFGPCIEIYALD